MGHKGPGVNYCSHYYHRRRGSGNSLLNGILTRTLFEILYYTLYLLQDSFTDRIQVNATGFVIVAIFVKHDLES